MHYLNPSHHNAHVVILYRNFMAHNPQFCHVGLGVNALHTVKVLRRHKVRADTYGVWTPEDVIKTLQDKPTVTHCILEAPWVSTEKLARILHTFPNTHFIVRAHSQIGFLQVEAGAVKLIREQLILQEQALNLNVSANSNRLAEYLEQVYNAHCLYLPNLYDTERVHRKHHTHHDHRVLRVGGFGAMRLLKNHTTAAAAALMIAKQRGCDLEYWVSTNREEHGKGVLQTLRNMFTGVPWAKLVENPWQDWASFRRTVAHMDLCMQPSFTETYNLVSSDAVTEHVPSVVSHAIEWAPDHWKAEVDSVEDIARVGTALLSNPREGEIGLKALERYVRSGTKLWLGYLNRQPVETSHDNDY